MRGGETRLNQRQFAQLCDVSQQMVSKYLLDGRLVVDVDGRIDAQRSLEALAGHLDEEKRALALQKLALRSQSAADASKNAPQAAPIETTVSAKQDHDRIKRDLAALELAERAGELIKVVDVEERIYDAVAKMRQAYDATVLATAERLARDLQLTQERVPLIARHLRRGFNDAQVAFVARLAPGDTAGFTFDDAAVDTPVASDKVAAE